VGLSVVGGLAGCCKCVGLAREISLTAEARLVVVSVKVHVAFELDDVCFIGGK